MDLKEESVAVIKDKSNKAEVIRLMFYNRGEWRFIPHFLKSKDFVYLGSVRISVRLKRISL